MLIKSEQLSVGSLIKNVMLKYLFWASYILRLCAQTCTPNRHALGRQGLPGSWGQDTDQVGTLWGCSQPLTLRLGRSARICTNLE